MLSLRYMGAKRILTLRIIIAGIYEDHSKISKLLVPGFWRPIFQIDLCYNSMDRTAIKAYQLAIFWSPPLKYRECHRIVYQCLRFLDDLTAGHLLCCLCPDRILQPASSQLHTKGGPQQVSVACHHGFPWVSHFSFADIL